MSRLRCLRSGVQHPDPYSRTDKTRLVHKPLGVDGEIFVFKDSTAQGTEGLGGIGDAPVNFSVNPAVRSYYGAKVAELLHTVDAAMLQVYGSPVFLLSPVGEAHC